MHMIVHARASPYNHFLNYNTCQKHMSTTKYMSTTKWRSPLQLVIHHVIPKWAEVKPVTTYEVITCTNLAAHVPNGPVGSPSPSLGLLDLLNAINSELACRL